MRGERLAKNTISSFILQITTIICGFILPRLILQSFGSEVNGLVNSITQFLALISFLELGVGSVVQSSLYKPLVDNNNEQISKVIVSAGKFFKRLAQIFMVYIIILMIVYPVIAKQNFGWVYSASLIAAISISSLAQYYFGIVDNLLLTADQRGYIQYTAQTVTLVLNTCACAILIHLGAAIHIVKLTTSLIFLLRPVVLRTYVNKNYHLNRKISYQDEPIKQKWNGVLQHIAAVVLDSTDSIVLTTLATLSEVSIYSVYNLVLYGVKQMFMSMTSGIRSLIGELLVKQKNSELEKVFGWTEWTIHTGTIFVFGSTGMLILPFVQVYTKGIYDVNYIQPLFAVLITMAHAAHCLRLPYNIMILAGGHYKQTQHNYIIATLINIIISIISVKSWGLVGVAIGTLAAMTYQTIWMAVYNSKNFLNWPLRRFVKQVLVDLCTVVLGIICTRWLHLRNENYLSLVILAVEVAVIWGGLILLVNSLFYKDKIIGLLKKVTKKIGL